MGCIAGFRGPLIDYSVRGCRWGVVDFLFSYLFLLLQFFLCWR